MTACSVITTKENAMLAWLKDQLSDKKIPFSVFEFVPSSETNWDEYKKVKVAGLEIPQLNDLTQTERIILDTVRGNNLLSQIKLQKIFRELVGGLGAVWEEDILAEISTELDEELAAIATGESKSSKSKVMAKAKALEGLKAKKEYELRNYLFPPTGGEEDDLGHQLVAQTSAYQSFQFVNEGLYEHIYSLTGKLDIQGFTNMVLVKFFLASRLGNEWLEDSRVLLSKQVNAVIEFITLEANGGVEPETEPSDNTETEGKA